MNRQISLAVMKSWTSTFALGHPVLCGDFYLARAWLIRDRTILETLLHDHECFNSARDLSNPGHSLNY